MRPNLIPVEAPTFQIDPLGLHVAVTTASYTAGEQFSKLDPPQALQILASVLLQRAPDNDIKLREPPYGYAKIIAAGYNGNEETQPDPVMTFLGAMVTEQFVVEILRRQTAWDRLRAQHTIVDSMPFGNPLPRTRTPQNPRRIGSS